MIPHSDQLLDLATVTHIRMAEDLHETVIEHGRRKVAGVHMPGETPERKAFGLLAGAAIRHCAEITHVFPIPRNVRAKPPFKDDIDELCFELAVPSETPLEQRGWLIDPQDLFAVQQTCDAAGVALVGSYHTHRVGWDTDPVRDGCTALDQELARGTSLWMFVLSLVDTEHPILRAYFEGDNDREARIVVQGAH
jgi:hypothetical protein